MPTALPDPVLWRHRARLARWLALLAQVTLAVLLLWLGVVAVLTLVYGV